MKLMAIGKICVSAYNYNTVNQARFNKSMLHRPPSHLAEKTVLLISDKGASGVSFRDRLKLRELLGLVPWASQFEHH